MYGFQVLAAQQIGLLTVKAWLSVENQTGEKGGL